MKYLKAACWLLPFGLALMFSQPGCSDGGGGTGARFVPNDNRIENVDGMSPSQAFHKNDRKRR